MGLLREAVKKILGIPEAAISEAIGGGVVLGEEKDAHLWRPLTGQKVDRELTPMKQDRMYKIAFWLYDQVGMAKRLLNMQTEFVLGEGLRYKAKNPDVQKVLDDFWNDPANNWNLSQHDKVTELGIFGEQFYPVFVNEHSGRVKMGIIDPQGVDKIKTNPENVAEPTEVITKSGINIEVKTYRVVHLNEETGLLEGDIFFFATNKISTATRGRSDLFAIADYIDAYDRFIFNRAERAHIMNQFFYDIEINGATQEQVDEFAKKTDMPKPGSMRFHNENVKWKAEVPKFEANDASAEARLLRNHVLGCFGIPAHYFAEGDKTTRATALEMNEPTFKKFKLRQKYVRHMIESIFNFVIDQAIAKQKLSKDVDKTFQVIFPKITGKDLIAIAQALQQVTTSLVLAVDNEFISRKKANEVYANQVSQLGVEVEADEELRESINDDKKLLEDYRRQNAKTE